MRKKEAKAAQPTPSRPRPEWEKFLDPQERPNREDLAADHHVMESFLEPVPLPRWLRGRRRVPREKRS